MIKKTITFFLSILVFVVHPVGLFAMQLEDRNIPSLFELCCTSLFDDQESILDEIKSSDWVTGKAAMSKGLQALFIASEESSRKIPGLAKIRNKLSLDMDFCLQKLDGFKYGNCPLVALGQNCFAIASGSNIYIYQWTDGVCELKEQLTIKNDWVNALMAIDLDHFACATDDTIIIWEYNQSGYAPIQTIKNLPKSTHSLSNLTTHSFTSNSSDAEIKIWKLQENSYTLAKTIEIEDCWFYTLIALNSEYFAFTSDKTKNIEILRNNGTEYLVDHEVDHSGQKADPENPDEKEWIHTLLALNPHRFVSAGHDNHLKIWQLTNNRYKLQQTIDLEMDWTDHLANIDSYHFASTGQTNALQIWQQTMQGYELSQTLLGHEKSASRLAMLNDQYLVSSSRYNGTVRIWDLHKDLSLFQLALVRILAQHKANETTIPHVSDKAQELFNKLPERFIQRFGKIICQ